MGSVRPRPESGLLFLDFRYEGKRCREQTDLPDCPENRRRLAKVLKRIEAEIVLGTFDYGKTFPNSPHALRTEPVREKATASTPLFSDFAMTWFRENTPRWKRSMVTTVEGTLRHHLIPHFGAMAVSDIKKGRLLEYRAILAERSGQQGRKLSPDRINHIMTRLRMILSDAAERFEFPNPWVNIKPLKIPKSQVDPFSLEEMKIFLDGVRPDFRNYYVVRFFTGMRTGEIDGLKWKHVDLDNRAIHIQEAVVNGLVDTPKTQASYRAIQMSTVVYAALTEQMKITGTASEYVFCTTNGRPFNHHNITQRVWYPTLRLLGLKRRRPYQTRHTAASLWLASGENPEWVARQLGHANTQMLFKIYSRFVPNLTRQDGSAFEKLLESQSITQRSQPRRHHEADKHH